MDLHFFDTGRALGECWFSIGFHKVFLAYPPVPHWGAVAGSFPERGHFRCFASFPIVFDDFWLTMLGSTFFLTRRAAPLGDADFPLVLQGFPYVFACAPLGGQ